MRPVDPRLLRQATAARGYLVLTVVLGLATTALILAQALLAHALAAPAAGTGVAALGATLAVLLAVLAGRAVTAYGGELAALRAAAAVKSQLRRKLTAQVLRLGPAWLGGQRTGELATLSTKGLDALDPYFARFLPQLVLAVPGAGGGAGPGGAGRLDLRGGDRGHAAPDPGLRGADRVADPGPDRAAVAAAGPPRRALPRRGRGAAHAQAVRPGPGPGRGDPRSHRRAPARDHAHAAGGVPVRPGAGAVRGHRDGAGGGGGRAAAAGRAHPVPDRAAGPAAHPRGVPAAARGRPAVPREHGGGHRGRPRLRDPRHPPSRSQPAAGGGPRGTRAGVWPARPGRPAPRPYFP